MEWLLFWLNLVLEPASLSARAQHVLFSTKILIKVTSAFLDSYIKNDLVIILFYDHRNSQWKSPSNLFAVVSHVSWIFPDWGCTNHVLDTAYVELQLIPEPKVTVAADIIYHFFFLDLQKEISINSKLQILSYFLWQQQDVKNNGTITPCCCIT